MSCFRKYRIIRDTRFDDFVYRPQVLCEDSNGVPSWKYLDDSHYPSYYDALDACSEDSKKPEPIYSGGEQIGYVVGRVHMNDGVCIFDEKHFSRDDTEKWLTQEN